MSSNFADFDADRELAGVMADLFDNPLGFVLFNYHWGHGDVPMYGVISPGATEVQIAPISGGSIAASAVVEGHVTYLYAP